MITSSVVGIIPMEALMGGDAVNVYSSASRVTPLPSAPFNPNPGAAYFASKTLALDATEKFLEEKKPHFSIVNIMPGFILGRNELVKVADDLLNGTNVVVLGPVLGQQMTPRPYVLLFSFPFLLRSFPFLFKNLNTDIIAPTEEK